MAHAFGWVAQNILESIRELHTVPEFQSSKRALVYQRISERGISRISQNRRMQRKNGNLGPYSPKISSNFVSGSPEHAEHSKHVLEGFYTCSFTRVLIRYV